VTALTKHERKTDIKFLGEVAWGTHVCLFYETKEDLLDTLVPYFKAGLESKEFCLWAVSEPLTEDDAINALRQSVSRFDRFLANRSIEIISAREWYLDGDRFDLKRVIGGWNEKLRNALAKGFKAMRVSGNTSWLNSKHWKDFCAYERDLNESIAGQRMSVLCTFSLAASEPSDILDVASAHQFAIARRNGEWEFINTVTPQTLAHSLTPRELEVLRWAARGKTAKDIAQILHITKRTADEHAQNVIRKLGAVNRTHAIAIALQNHIVKI
jgi:DNA-binding CsgD family transcriptional regulator